MRASAKSEERKAGEPVRRRHVKAPPDRGVRPPHDCFDFSVFIDAHWRTQLQTRLERDIRERGYSPRKAIETFLHSNLLEFEIYGAASKHWADIHLHCDAEYRLTADALCATLAVLLRMGCFGRRHVGRHCVGSRPNERHSGFFSAIGPALFAVSLRYTGDYRAALALCLTIMLVLLTQAPRAVRPKIMTSDD